MSCNSFNDLTDFLNQMGSNVRQTLNQIQQIDIECLKIQIQLQKKRQDYLDWLQQTYQHRQLKYVEDIQLRQIQSSENIEQDENIECDENIEYDKSIEYDESKQQTQLMQIRQLQLKLKELTRQKIFKAEQISNKVDDGYLKSQSVFVRMIGGQPMDQEYNSERKQQIKSNILEYELNSLGLRKKKGRQKIINPRVQNVYEKYYEVESQQTAANKLCICSSVIETQPMIMCQNIQCPIQWYHLKCIGLQEANIPVGDWFCQKCMSELQKFKKIKFSDKFYETELIFGDQQISEGLDMKTKRLRGRSKKHQMQQNQLQLL